MFRPSHRLRSLTEVASLIKEHHHLPEIPTETEVQQKGVSLGEMQVKLLAKIEELTLHMIAAEDRSARLERQNQEVRDRFDQIERQNRELARRMAVLETIERE